MVSRIQEFPTWLATANERGVAPEQSLGDWINARLDAVAEGAVEVAVVRGIGESLLGGFMECVRTGRVDKVVEFTRQIRGLDDSQKLVCANGIGSAAAGVVDYHRQNPIDPIALREHDIKAAGLIGAILGSMGRRE